MKDTFPATMTDQELFDTVARHLFEQGERAAINGYCQYRIKNKDGSFDKKRCAIGRCFPDSEYNPEMEGKSVAGLIGSGFDALDTRFAGNHYRLLSDLQNVHDTSMCWVSTTTMKDQLRNVAQRYQLDASVLDGLSFNGR